MLLRNYTKLVGMILLLGLVKAQSGLAASTLTVDFSAWSMFGDDINACAPATLRLPDPQQFLALKSSLANESGVEQAEINAKLEAIYKTYQILGIGQSQCLMKITANPSNSLFPQNMIYQVCIFPITSLPTLSQAAKEFSTNMLNEATISHFNQIENTYCRQSVWPYWRDG